MYEVNLLNLETNKRFTKIFWNLKTLEYFKKKCSYSTRVIITSIKDNSKFYD